MPTENPHIPIPGLEDLPEAIQNTLAFSRNFATAKPDIAATEKEHILGLANLLEQTTRKLAGKEAQPVIRFGAYGVALSSEQWDCIHQMAFELGGTEGGEYHLAAEDLNELVSHVFVATGFPNPYLDEDVDAEPPLGIDSEGGSHD